MEKYEERDYASGEFNLLRAERNLLKKVLASNNMTQAHKILCPKENRRYCFKTFCKRVEMHNLK